MNIAQAINTFVPSNQQEEQDKKVILDYIDQFPHNILLRDNEFAHITSSGFILNKELNKVLMVHHNIRGCWAWTGGHVDGDTDWLSVAEREAMEETGIRQVDPLSSKIASLDILPVFGHFKKGSYVSAHQHLSVAYILIADETQQLVVNEAENSGVKWFPVEMFTPEYFSARDLYLYRKLVDRARD